MLNGAGTRIVCMPSSCKVSLWSGRVDNGLQLLFRSVPHWKVGIILQSQARRCVMSLPVLCPAVAKAPIHVSHPQQRLPTPNQQALFSLLKKRHERYLAQKEKRADIVRDLDGSVHSLTTLQLRTDAGKVKPHHLHLNAHTSLHMLMECGTREPQHHDHLCNIREGVSLVSLPDCDHTPSCSEGNQSWPGHLGRFL